MDGARSRAAGVRALPATGVIVWGHATRRLTAAAGQKRRSGPWRAACQQRRCFVDGLRESDRPSVAAGRSSFVRHLPFLTAVPRTDSRHNPPASGDTGTEFAHLSVAAHGIDKDGIPASEEKGGPGHIGRMRAGRRTSAASLVVVSDLRLVGVAVLPRNQVLVIDGGKRTDRAVSGSPKNPRCGSPPRVSPWRRLTGRSRRLGPGAAVAQAANL